MRTRPTILYYGPVDVPVPELIRRWAENKGFPLLVLERRDEVESIVMRGHPSLLVVDGERMAESAKVLVAAIKADPFSAIVPVTVLEGAHDPESMQQWFAAGADEILTAVFPPPEQRARLDAMLVRTQRDVAVHPSTRMPGTTEIEREIRRQLETGHEFAVCYADLDHFKEFNDRYSYYDGDRVIYLLSRILHDVVKGLQGPRGFVGHIGGDDFIFILPAEAVDTVCTEILDVFDTLVPLQYNEQDSRAGYFFGKDRRGQLHRVPLMTLSIGIVTNRHRNFSHPAEVSELATEMKSYAKTLPGSVYVVDRRRARDAEGRGVTGREPR
ncbi:MAG TPA: diguanylate cyclase [Gemmatimonadales bacterium]